MLAAARLSMAFQAPGASMQRGSWLWIFGPPASNVMILVLEIATCAVDMLTCPFSRPLSAGTPVSEALLFRFEGPHCSIDINECVRGTDNCGANSTCINTVGGFTCTCWHGFTGLNSDPHSSCTLSEGQPPFCYPVILTRWPVWHYVQHHPVIQVSRVRILFTKILEQHVGTNKPFSQGVM